MPWLIYHHRIIIHINIIHNIIDIRIGMTYHYTLVSTSAHVSFSSTPPRIPQKILTMARLRCSKDFTVFPGSVDGGGAKSWFVGKNSRRWFSPHDGLNELTETTNKKGVQGKRPLNIVIVDFGKDHCYYNIILVVIHFINNSSGWSAWLPGMTGQPGTPTWCT